MTLLAADPRVDLDVTDREGKSLEEMTRWLFPLLALLSNSQHCIISQHKCAYK